MAVLIGAYKISILVRIPQKQTVIRFLSVIIASISLFSPPAYATIDDQINALKQQAAQQQATANGFAAQANDYQGKVDQLNAQIGALVAQIHLNQAEYDRVVAQIAANQIELDKQKKVLGDNLKSMYINSGVTPLEMLVSSKNLSDYFDQQQYQDSIKNKIQDALATIAATQKQLDAERVKVDGILADEKNQQAQLDASRAEVGNLLAVASQNVAAANAQVQQSNSQISTLRAQQAAILASTFRGGGLSGGGACGGGYPGYLCNAGQDTIIDSWGMYNRECVSYTAFRVAASGRHMPYWGGRGNAKQWPSSAEADGIAVDGNPRVGDVAISLAGPYGHAMYVEGVSGGSIHVSQYNFGNNGEYSTMTVSASGLYFIHF